MIKQNYPGNSNIIKRIVAILNKKAPLPLDQQGEVDWGTDGKVLATDGVGETKWVDPGSGGGDVTDVEVNGTSVVNAQGVAEVSVPTKTSDLNNDSDFVSDASYVHTDENFTSTEKAKLGGIETGAEVNVQSDWNQTDTAAADYIKNKPTIPSSSGHTIWNRIKTALTARGKLWFADASVSDVSADDATKVEVVTELASESAFDNLPTDGTADGIYTFPDSGGEYLTAEMVGYENTNVKTALDGKVSKSGDTISGNLNVTGNLQKNGTNVLLAGEAVTRMLLWYVFETQCDPGSRIANPLVTYSVLSQYDEIHIEVGVGMSGNDKQIGAEIISKEMLSIMNTYGDIVFHTTNAAGISNNTFYKVGFFVQLSGGSLIIGNHTQGYTYNYMRIRVEGIKYN